MLFNSPIFYKLFYFVLREGRVGHKRVGARVGSCLPPYGSQGPNSGFVRLGGKHLRPDSPLVNPVPILLMQEGSSNFRRADVLSGPSI